MLKMQDLISKDLPECLIWEGISAYLLKLLYNTIGIWSNKLERWIQVKCGWWPIVSFFSVILQCIFSFWILNMYELLSLKILYGDKKKEDVSFLINSILSLKFARWLGRAVLWWDALSEWRRVGWDALSEWRRVGWDAT